MHLSPAYNTLFTNFDMLVNQHGSLPNPSQTVQLCEIVITGLPMEDTPSIEIYDVCNGLVYQSHDYLGDSAAEYLCREQCIWSGEYGNGSYVLTNCVLTSDFAIVCRFGGEYASVKDRTTLIFKYQNHAGFISMNNNTNIKTNTPRRSTAPSQSYTLLHLGRDDVDISPAHLEFISHEEFKLTLKLLPVNTNTTTINTHNIAYLNPHTRVSFDYGLEEVNDYYCIII